MLEINHLIKNPYLSNPASPRYDVNVLRKYELIQIE